MSRLQFQSESPFLSFLAIVIAMATSTNGSVAPRFKLVYYPLRGRAELIRLVFEHLEISYIDERISFEEWARRKSDSPFGVIPILEFDGRVVSGSTAIASWIAQENGFAGSNNVDNLEIFSIVDAAADAWVFIYDANFHEKNEELKKRKLQRLHEKYLPQQIAYFERKAAANSKQGGWIWGNKMTYADFATYLLYDYVVKNIPGALKNYPGLAKIKQNVESLPKIAKWIKRRPDTPL